MVSDSSAARRRLAAVTLAVVLLCSALAGTAVAGQSAQSGQPTQSGQTAQPAETGQTGELHQTWTTASGAQPVQLTAPAQSTGGNVIVEANETVDSLDAFAGTVVVRGTVRNDVEAIGGTIRIADTGRVGGDVDATGGSITVDGAVNGSARAVGGSVVVGESAQIGEGLEVAAGSLTLEGSVAEDVRAAASSISVTSSATVGGDLQYDADSFDIADGATIQGEVVQVDDLGGQIGGGFGAPSIPWWVWTGFWFVANLLLGAVLVGLLPAFSRRVADEVAEHPLRSGGVGLGLLIGVPILLALLAITVVGIPLALLGAGIYVAMLWIGTVYGAYVVGAWGLGLAGVDSRWLALVGGLLAMAILGAIPYLGGLVEFVVLLLGIGALAVALWSRFRGRDGEEPGDRQATLGERAGDR